MSLNTKKLPASKMTPSPSNDDTKQHQPSPQYSILSYNVNFGGSYDPDNEVGGQSRNTKLVVQAIEQSAADVCLLQETHKGWEKACQELKHIYPYQSWVHPTGGWLAAGLAVMVKQQHSLLAVDLYQPKCKGSFFPGMRVRIAFEGGHEPIDIVNVHLRPPLPMGNGSLFGFATLKAFFYETTRIRKQELDELMIHFEQPHLIVGDCNEDSSGHAWKHMIESGYQDALQLSSSKTTWYWPLFWKANLWASYDHIFCDTKRIRIRQCSVLQDYKHVSDHMPVIAVISENPLATTNCIKAIPTTKLSS